MQGLLQRIADRTLAVGPANVQRYFVQTLYLIGDLRPAEDEAYLRAVAVANRYIPAGFDHIGNVVGGFFSGLVLILDRLVSLIPDKGIAADANHGNFFLFLVHKGPLCPADFLGSSFNFENITFPEALI